jgi:hypothetical protein
MRASLQFLDISWAWGPSSWRKYLGGIVIQHHITPFSSAQQDYLQPTASWIDGSFAVGAKRRVTCPGGNAIKFNPFPLTQALKWREEDS